MASTTLLPSLSSGYYSWEPSTVKRVLAGLSGEAEGAFMGDEIWLTKTEACERLSVGLTTLDDLIAHGLPVVRLGRRAVRIPARDLEEWAAEQSPGAGEQP